MSNKEVSIKVADGTVVKGRLVEADGTDPVYPDLKYCVIRCRDAGAWAGYVQNRKAGSTEVELLAARRLWYWDGASSLSELAAKGVARPKNCKFPVAVDVILTDVIEVIPATEEARISVEGVPEWKQHTS